MVWRRWSALAVMILLAGLLVACSSSGVDSPSNTMSNANGESDSASSHSDEKMTVAVSIVPEKTFVKKVGGDHVKAVTLIPPGSSPGTYEPTSKIMEKASDAQVYFPIHVPTEKANILPKVKDFNQDLQIVNLWDTVAEKYPPLHFSNGAPNPHVWLSPKRVIGMIHTIEDNLSSLDPEHQADYEKNAKAYIQQLQDLDNHIQNALKPLEQRAFIAYHPAFGYFAKDYNMSFIALEKEGKEATPQRMQKVIDKAKKKGIKVIFYQAEIDSKQSKAFAQELDGKTVELKPLAPNYIENMKKMANTLKSVME